MLVAIPKELIPNETRVAVVPAAIKDLVKAGLTVQVEAGAGEKSFFSDQEYIDAGATIVSDTVKLWTEADLILKVNHPVMNETLGKHEAELMKEGATFVSLFQTTREKDAVKRLMEQKVNAFSMHLIPRTTLAQKMDALSSQSNIAGYKAVLLGASHLGKYMPLLMTAAGTIPPSKTLVLGAGVAGLQAIATAKRLGAQVEAFDVRPVVKEQVESLGAKFVEVETDSDEGVGEGGYAKETSEEYKQKQRALIKDHISKSDLVITTALIPGRPAPILIPKDVLEVMKPGSVIMDLAAENGGNCELTKPGEIITVNKVIIDGSLNLPGTMPVHASTLYAKNITSFITYLIKEGEINFDMEDEIIAGAMFLKDGNITNELTKQAMEN